jgi:catechol 1,2-dioxygenase
MPLTSEDVAKFRAYERSLQTGPQDPRLAHVLNRFMDVMYPLILELKPTMDEWSQMITYLGSLDRVQTNLALWLTGCTQLVEELNCNLDARATQIGVEGPFFVDEAPLIGPDDTMSKDPGEADWLFLDGQVKDLEGKPIAGVTLHVWSSNHKGTYSNFDPAAEAFDCRGRVITDADGRYKIKTAYPANYAIGGPCLPILQVLGRQPWRPRHVHFMVDDPRFEKLVMQVCFEGDPYNRIDSALAVKEEHIVPVAHHTNAEDIHARGLNKPFYTCSYDFVLQPIGYAKAA